MKKKAITTGATIIATAIIWGLVFIGCSFKLKGTECYSEIQNILYGGFMMSFLLSFSSGFVLLKKNKVEKNKENIT